MASLLAKNAAVDVKKASALLNVNDPPTPATMLADNPLSPHDGAAPPTHASAWALESRTCKLFISGGLAGAVSRTATAPLDRLKLLLQVHDAKHGMTVAQGLRHMASEGTYKAYFRGNGANVLKNIPETALKLTANDVVKQLVAQDGAQSLTPAQRVVIGGLAGAAAQAATYPLEVIQTRLAVSPRGTYRGIADAALKTVRLEGVRALYRGMTPCMVGIWPYAGIDIAAFELMKEWLGARYAAQQAPQGLVAYPLSLVRARLQAQGAGGAPAKYAGMTDVLVKTVQREGVRGLYKGVLPDLLKTAPAAGICWLVFEWSKQCMDVDDLVHARCRSPS